MDLLGFSNYTQTDTNSALILLENQQLILNQKIADNKIHPEDSYHDEEEKLLAERCLIDSFEYFLPFSDSVFIIATSPDKFVKQLSCFLLECFRLTADSYSNPEDEKNPTEINNKGKVKIEKIKEDDLIGSLFIKNPARQSMNN